MALKSYMSEFEWNIWLSISDNINCVKLSHPLDHGSKWIVAEIFVFNQVVMQNDGW